LGLHGCLSARHRPQMPAGHSADGETQNGAEDINKEERELRDAVRPWGLWENKWREEKMGWG
jgi:hypothetical protein